MASLRHRHFSQPTARRSAAINWQRLGRTASGLSESSVERDGLGLETAVVKVAWPVGSGDLGVARRRRRNADVAQLAVDVLAKEGNPIELLHYKATVALSRSGSSQPRKQSVSLAKLPFTGRQPWELILNKTSFQCVMVSFDLRQMQRQPQYPSPQSMGWFAADCQRKRTGRGDSSLELAGDSRDSPSIAHRDMQAAARRIRMLEKEEP